MEEKWKEGRRQDRKVGAIGYSLGAIEAGRREHRRKRQRQKEGREEKRKVGS